MADRSQHSSDPNLQMHPNLQNNNPKHSNRCRGQLLIESMIAITIVVVGILAVFTLLSESQSLNRVVADRYIGTYLASEGLELIKNLIDKNYIQQLPWNSA